MYHVNTWAHRFSMIAQNAVYSFTRMMEMKAVSVDPTFIVLSLQLVLGLLRG